MRQPQVCDHCGGRFGLVTHRWWSSKFCKRTCKTYTSVNLRSAEIKSGAGAVSSREMVSENCLTPDRPNTQRRDHHGNGNGREALVNRKDACSDEVAAHYTV